MKRKILCALLALTLCLLSGCKPAFSRVDEPPEESDPVEELRSANSYINHYGFDGNLEMDSDGLYYTYEGGEMSVTCVLGRTGMDEFPVGVLLFLDGKPQPYKTEDEDEYSYMHLFYPPRATELKKELRFTPVAGREGDTLELAMTWVSLEKGPNELGGIIARMKYMSDTPGIADSEITAGEIWQAEESNCRLLDCSNRYEAWSTDGWSQEQLASEISFGVYVNDRYTRSPSSLEIKDREESLTIRVELKGASDGLFGLVAFVNYQPIALVGEDIAMMILQLGEGEKAVIEFRLDVSGMKDGDVIHILLVPRNYRQNKLGLSCALPTVGFFKLAFTDDE